MRRTALEIPYSFELEAPRTIAYDIFRHVEELPRILPVVREVTPEDPNGIRFRFVLGDENESLCFDAELIEATVDRRLAWRNLEGSIESGVIDFARVNSKVTRLDVVLVLRAGAESVAEFESHFERLGDQLLLLKLFVAELLRSPRPAAGAVRVA